MKSEFNFEAVIGRLKKALQIKEDKQMAELLGMSPAAFNGRKKSDSIPFDAVISLSAKENLDCNWLLTGEGAMLKGGGANETPVNPEIKKTMDLLLSMDELTRKKAVEAVDTVYKFNQMERFMSQQMQMQGGQMQRMVTTA